MVEVAVQEDGFGHGGSKFGEEGLRLCEQGRGERTIPTLVVLPQSDEAFPPIADRCPGTFAGTIMLS
jgi:hypothetical protein